MTNPLEDDTDKAPCCPLDLKGEYLRRYETVRILRRFLDHEGRSPVIFDEDGTVWKGCVREHIPRLGGLPTENIQGQRVLPEGSPGAG